MNIFVYGSLMWKDLWDHEVRNQYPSKDASVKGFRCRKMKGKAEPVAIHSPPAEQHNERVHGKVYLDVNENDFKRITAYFGKEYEISETVCLTGESEVPISAKIFLLDIKFRDYLSEEDWTKEWFEQSALSDFRKKINESLL